MWSSLATVHAFKTENVENSGDSANSGDLIEKHESAILAK